MTPLNNPLFRPPAEADSLLLQIDQGCPYNRCTFCGMYRGQPYRPRSADEVKALILTESRRHPHARRVFLADGDVMRRPFDELRAILELLNGRLPQLSRVNLYANGGSIAAKSDTQLRSLRGLKLHTLYMGLESGDEEILRRCRKGETAERMVEAGIAAQAAGLRMSVMVLLGLGGADHSQAHAERTAAALNRMQPRLLSALRVIPVPGTELHEDRLNGRFRPLTEHQVAQELRRLVAGLELTATVFRANHTSNVIPIEARMPRDKAHLLSALARLLASGDFDTRTPGREPLWL
jgi:radical SAM superfamily enzyme YgiQ (UPF0313 family)